MRIKYFRIFRSSQSRIKGAGIAGCVHCHPWRVKMVKLSTVTLHAFSLLRSIEDRGLTTWESILRFKDRTVLFSRTQEMLRMEFSESRCQIYLDAIHALLSAQHQHRMCASKSLYCWRHQLEHVWWKASEPKGTFLWGLDSMAKFLWSLQKLSRSAFLASRYKRAWAVLLPLRLPCSPSSLRSMCALQRSHSTDIGYSYSISDAIHELLWRQVHILCPSLSQVEPYIAKESKGPLEFSHAFPIEGIDNLERWYLLILWYPISVLFFGLFCFCLKTLSLVAEAPIQFDEIGLSYICLKADNTSHYWLNQSFVGLSCPLKSSQNMPELAFKKALNDSFQILQKLSLWWDNPEVNLIKISIV